MSRDARIGPVAPEDLGLSEADKLDLDPGSTGDLKLESRSQPLTVELMADGRLRAPRQRTRELLRVRLQRAELLPTSPEWALFRNLERGLGQIQDHSGGREVVLAGTLGPSGVSLIDTIGFLASGLQTGVLSVIEGEVERSVYFSSGDVIWASSTAPEDGIGEFLVRRGRLTGTQLAAMARESPERIGRASVERGFISSHDLWAMVQAQLMEIFDHIIQAERGLWTFSRLDADALANSQVQFSTQGLLMDALRKLDEMRVFREVVRSPSSLVAWTPEILNDEHPERLFLRVDASVKDDLIPIVPHLSGTLSIQDLIRLSGKGEFFVSRVIYHLHRARLVTVRESTPSLAPVAPAQLSKNEARDLIQVYSMAIAEIMNELDAPGIEALSASAQAFLTDPNTPFAHVLTHVGLGRNGHIDADPLLIALAQTSVSLLELSEALSELLFFLLFEATEALGPRRRDDLARRVRMIHGMLRLPDAGGPTGEPP